MKLIIFGAAGKMGRVLLHEAQMQGHETVAFCRDRKQLEDHNKLSVIEGDATKKEDVETAIKGCNAVISVLGHTKKTPSDVQTRAMRSITLAMQHHKISRIISLTGAGVFAPDDKTRLLDRAGAAALALVDPYRLQDGIAHVEVLRNSELNWTVVRTPKHTYGSRANCRIGIVGPEMGLSVPRINVAEFMLQLAEDKNARLYELPVISRRSRLSKPGVHD